MKKLIDLSGQKFGKLTVLRRAEDYIQPCGKRRTRWLCRCSCENKTEVVVCGTDLKSGNTQSCGCLRKENHYTPHGKYKTSLYKTWKGIKTRCYNPKFKQYKNYGGRAGNPITVCDKWRNNFLSFYEDVSKLPHFGEKGYTLERVNNNKGYQLDNVKWATRKEQNNNTRRNHYITYNQKTLTMSQWSEKLNIPYSTIKARLKRGWTIERALTEKPKKIGGIDYGN